MQNLFDIDTVSEWTGRSRQAIYNERHRRRGIGVLGVRVGRKLMWRESDLERWFDEQVAERQQVAS